MSNDISKRAYELLDRCVLDSAGLPSYYGDLKPQEEEFFARLAEAVVEAATETSTSALEEVHVIASEVACELESLARHLLEEATSLRKVD